MKDDAAESSCLPDFRIYKAQLGVHATREDGLTNVERVVITAKAKYESLFRCCLVLDNPIWLLVFRNWLGLWRPSDDFRKSFPGSFGPKIERRTLSGA